MPCSMCRPLVVVDDFFDQKFGRILNVDVVLRGDEKPAYKQNLMLWNRVFVATYICVIVHIESGSLDQIKFDRNLWKVLFDRKESKNLALPYLANHQSIHYPLTQCFPKSGLQTIYSPRTYY